MGSVYEYFPNKESIFAALLLRWNEQRWQSFLEARDEGHEDTLEATIRATIRARIRAARINPALNRALRRGLPPKITDRQARDMHEVFLDVSRAALDRSRAASATRH